MSTPRIFVAVCATALLAAGLGGQQFARAEGRLAGIKGLFFAEKSSGKSYAILADHLYTATSSAELEDNIGAAGSLPSKHPDSKQDVLELARAFGSLKSNWGSQESFCSKDNLANLRRVAEGLRDGGNLGPEKITDAIQRLNGIVTKVIGDAREVCGAYLAQKWPKPWQPKFSDPAMKDRIVNLLSVSGSFVYEGFVDPVDDPFYEPTWPSKSMSYVVKKSERQAANPIDPDEPDPLKTENTAVIARQLDEYVYKPCTEFVLLDETEDVLAPFNDMLRSWYVVNSRLLSEYYKNKNVLRPTVFYSDSQVRDLAWSYEACRRLLAAPKKNWAKSIRKFRMLDNRSH